MRKNKLAAVAAQAVILLRVSTQRQADSGLGLEAQAAACLKVCAERGMPVLGSPHVDAGISGKDGLDKRPGLRAAIAAVKATPGAVLVVYSLSRLGRSQRLIWTLLDPAGEYAIPLVSASEPFDTSTPMGRAMLGMLGVWAQLEAELTSERTVAALGAARVRGTRLGAATMLERTVAVVGADGKTRNVRRVDERKVAVVREVQALYASGAYSFASLAAKLNADGVESGRGKRWHTRTVAVALAAKLPA